jgi:hypothetical protein
MALFTDGLMCGSEELREYESSVLEVARNEGVELTPKLTVAQREIALEVITFLMRHGAAHLDIKSGLANVVVTDALRHWHAMQSLAALYRDAYHQRMNDRYKEKWACYSAESRAARQTFFAIGVGISLNPIPRAEAPVCETVVGGQLPERTYLATVCWHAGGKNGDISVPVGVEVAEGHLLQVRVAQPPAGAGGWALYLGRDAGGFYASGAGVLGVDETWTEAGDPFAGSPVTPKAQEPDLFVRFDQRIQRG